MEGLDANCFALPGELTVRRYTDGAWVRRSDAQPRPYRILPALWASIGTSIKPSTPQHYGRCDDVAPDRPLYDWRPHRCTLRPFVPEGACELLRGRQVVFVGDSTLLQLFLSFVLLLQGRLGMNVRRATSVQDLTASACNDTVRLAFARSDLLLWTHAPRDFGSAKHCDGFLSLGTFIARAARDADWLVLGLEPMLKSCWGRAEVAGRKVGSARLLWLGLPKHLCCPPLSGASREPVCREPAKATCMHRPCPAPW